LIVWLTLSGILYDSEANSLSSRRTELQAINIKRSVEYKNCLCAAVADVDKEHWAI